MRIFFIINSLSNKSGSERVACVLANLFSEYPNFDVTLINRDTSKYNAAYSLSEKVTVVNIPGNILKFYEGISNLTILHSPDYIVVHNMGKLSLFCSLLKYHIKSKSKFISLEHGSFVGRPLWVKFLSNFFYKNFDKVIALTHKDRIDFSRIHNNVLVIPNICPYSIVEKTSYPKIILSVGRLDKNKNHIHLLEAWKVIQDKLQNWQLHIYGDGELKDFLNSYIFDKELKNVFLKGVSSDISKVYKNASLLCMTSKFEGLPMVLIESQAFGLPLISYNCPNGPSDIIVDAYNGFLVENQNIEHLSEKILELSTNESMLVKFSENSQKNALNYQPEKILDIWVHKVLEK